MRLRLMPTGNRPIPDEQYYQIKTADGDAKLVPLHDLAVREDSVEIGIPVGRNGDALLVELPQETSDGWWRVYVAADQLIAA